ncbi:glycoside hydrolase family 2 [Sesbania bispinosa]|nr:glycoside hydrolase family 2 [Sesbania bispinosa]
MAENPYLELTSDYRVHCVVPLAAKDDKFVERDGVTFVPVPDNTDENLKRNAKEGRNQVSRGDCWRVIIKNQERVFFVVRSPLQGTVGERVLLVCACGGAWVVLRL